MSEGAQLLYRQGLPFILSPSGWRLTYPIACQVLGYPETPTDFQPGMIRKYLKEIGTSVGWRVKEAGKGRSLIWTLKVSKKERADWWDREYRRSKKKRLTE